MRTAEERRDAHLDTLRAWYQQTGAALPITLNGEPARLVGITCDWPMVRSLTSEAQYVWAWDTVKDVLVNRGGAFWARAAVRS